LSFTAATGTWLMAKNGLQFFLKLDRKSPLGSFQALGGPFGFFGRFWALLGPLFDIYVKKLKGNRHQTSVPSQQ